MKLELYISRKLIEDNVGKLSISNRRLRNALAVLATRSPKYFGAVLDVGQKKIRASSVRRALLQCAT